MLTPKPWYETWSPGKPCSVTLERANENADYLRGVFGGAWIDRHSQRPSRPPLVQEWWQGGDDMFLRLNTLAEDLRVLEATPGLPPLVTDLKGGKSYEPALHTIHVAALFARGGNPISKFYISKNDSVPDFETQISNIRVPAEAKKLTQSGPALTFSRMAKQLMDEVSGGVEWPERGNPEVQIFAKNTSTLPPAADVVPIVQEAIGMYTAGQTVKYSGEHFKLRVLAARMNGGIHGRAIQIVGRRDDSEDERIERLLNKANKQLKKNTGGREPGLTCIAIGRYQDPRAIEALVKRKFAAGVFRSTTGVILHRYHRHEGPGPIATADMITCIRNPQAHVPLPPIPLKGTGFTQDLIQGTPVDGTVSCYSLGYSVMTVGPSTKEMRVGVDPIYRMEISAFD